MGKATSRRAVISGFFRPGGGRRRALRAHARPSIARQYDRLDRLQHLDPFPPEGLGIRTRLASCWRGLDRLAGRETLDRAELEDVVRAIDDVEDAIRLWRGPSLLTTGRHGVAP